MKTFATPKSAFVIMFFLLFLGVLIISHVLDLSVPLSELIRNGFTRPKYPQSNSPVPLNCTRAPNQTLTYPKNYTSSFQPAGTCPEYFRWIHEDLRPWNTTGITEKTLLRGKPTAAFRLTIVDGRVYIEKYRDWWQSRAVLNIWGILQLLRRYPDKLPDLDILFDCEDKPAILRNSYSTTSPPPPLFTYCADGLTFDIVFPDWSFWGWPEINIKPWSVLSKELAESNKRLKWRDREPYAYWIGNPDVAQSRKELMKCNVSKVKDWNARVYKQDWKREMDDGFKEANIANECTHRYKIYIEGRAWSVSEKYILACDSETLVVTPHYFDFFTRGLMPLHHYWPVKESTKCESIKYAVDWGESHIKEAQHIGRAGTEFVMKNLKMDYVYDYMLHLLNEYAKLLNYKPTIPPKAVVYTSECMVFEAQGLLKTFMMDSMEKEPALTKPCSMPPPYDLQTIAAMKKQQQDSIKTVEQ